MLRSTLAVVGGYVTLIIGVSAFFAIVTWLNPQLLDVDAPAPGWLYFAEAGVSLLVAVIGGYVTGWLAPERPVFHGGVLASIMVVLGLLTLVGEWGMKPVWSSLFLAFVPPAMVVLGARLRQRAAA